MDTTDHRLAEHHECSSANFRLPSVVGDAGRSSWCFPGWGGMKDESGHNKVGSSGSCCTGQYGLDM